MNIIKIVSEIKKTQQQLIVIYTLTFQDYISLDSLKLSNKVINLLLKKSMLYRFSDSKDSVKYKWTGIKPTFALSYDFHHQLRGNNKNYRDVKKKAENPQLLEPNEIIEVLALVAQENIKSNGEREKLEELNSNEDVNTIQFSENLIPSQVFKKHPSMETETLIDLKILKDALTDPNQSTLLGLLSEIIEFLMENNETLKSVQNTQRMVIAISKSNQNNLFDLVASEYNLIREQYHSLKEICDNSDNNDLEKRLEYLATAIQHMKKRIDENNRVINKYY